MDFMLLQKASFADQSCEEEQLLSNIEPTSSSSLKFIVLRLFWFSSQSWPDLFSGGCNPLHGAGFFFRKESRYQRVGLNKCCFTPYDILAFFWLPVFSMLLLHMTLWPFWGTSSPGFRGSGVPGVCRVLGVL